MWDHVIATDLRPILNFFEWILGVARSIVHEKLLDSGCFILVFYSRFARKKTYCAELVADYKGLAVGAEFPIEWVVTLVAIDRIYTVLVESLQ